MQSSVQPMVSTFPLDLVLHIAKIGRADPYDCFHLMCMCPIGSRSGLSGGQPVRSIVNSMLAKCEAAGPLALSLICDGLPTLGLTLRQSTASNFWAWTTSSTELLDALQPAARPACIRAIRDAHSPWGGAVPLSRVPHIVSYFIAGLLPDLPR